ncbi:MAG: YceI family protein [Blastocatellia bacterium]
MTTFKNAALLAVLALTCALALHSGLLFSGTARAQGTKPVYAPVASGAYLIDPAHSTIGFAIRHLEINWVTGRFRDFRGMINYDAADIAKSTVEFVAKVESVDTSTPARDAHLRNQDFFDAPKFPEMTFKSTRVERKGKDSYILHGNLTIKDVTKAISFPFVMTGAIKDAKGNTRFGIEAKTTINRRDYGINYGGPMPTGGLDIGNEVMISLNLEALQPAPKPVVGQ